MKSVKFESKYKHFHSCNSFKDIYCKLAHFLITWLDFNPRKYTKLHWFYSVGWNRHFNGPTVEVYWACDWLCVPRLKLIRVDKSDTIMFRPRCVKICTHTHTHTQWNTFVPWCAGLYFWFHPSRFGVQTYGRLKPDSMTSPIVMTSHSLHVPPTTPSSRHCCSFSPYWSCPSPTLLLFYVCGRNDILVNE